MPRRPGRPKAGDEILSRPRILAAALAIIDHAGVDALSMRRLAAALGVDPMAIYRHLPDKAAVIAGVVERVFGEFHVPAAADRGWQDDVRAFAAAYRSLVQAHPALIVYLITHTEASAPAALAAGEFLYAALARAPLSPRQIVRAADVIVDYLNGFALGESTGRMNQPMSYDDLYALLDQLPPDRYPTMQRIYGALTPAELTQDPLGGLEVVIAGIEAWIEAGRTPSHPSPKGEGAVHPSL